MAKTKSEMFALIGQKIPDNDSGLIKPADLREPLTQLADSMLYSALGIKLTEVLRASATTDQGPTALGTPLQVNFGAAQGTAASPVMLSSAGLVTFNQAGSYTVSYTLHLGHASGAGLISLMARLLLGSSQYGPTSMFRFDTGTAIFPVQQSVTISVTAGQTMALQILRDAVLSSTNAGGLYTTTPATSGWSACPSASIVISRLEPVT